MEETEEKDGWAKRFVKWVARRLKVDLQIGFDLDDRDGYVKASRLRDYQIKTVEGFFPREDHLRDGWGTAKLERRETRIKSDLKKQLALSIEDDIILTSEEVTGGVMYRGKLYFDCDGKDTE